MPPGVPGAKTRLRDVFVFVNDQKVFFKVVPEIGARPRGGVPADVPLKPGNNVVTVFAREDEEYQSRRTFSSTAAPPPRSRRGRAVVARSARWASAPSPGLELRLERGRVQVRLRRRAARARRAARGGWSSTSRAGRPRRRGRPASRFRSRLCDLDRLELAVASRTQPPRSPRAVARRDRRRAARAPRRRSSSSPARLGGRRAVHREGSRPLPGGASAAGRSARARALYAVAPLPAPALAPRLAALRSPPAAGARAEGPSSSWTRSAARSSARAPAPRLEAARARRGARPARARDPARRRCGSRWTRWDRAGGGVPDPDLRAFVHGAPSVRAPEALLASGELAAARDGVARAARPAPAHTRSPPRALLGVPRRATRGSTREAHALARGALDRDPVFAPALAAEALIAGARGDGAAAARAGRDARASSQRARGEAFSALAAADACAAAGRRRRPARARSGARRRAGPRPRATCPALRALRDLAPARGIGAALLRACRGLAAHAPEPAEKARAHARLAVLLAIDRPRGRAAAPDHARRLGAGGRG